MSACVLDQTTFHGRFYAFPIARVMMECSPYISVNLLALGLRPHEWEDTEDLVHFYPQYFHSNTFKLQFDREDTPSPRLLYSIVHKNKAIIL